MRFKVWLEASYPELDALVAELQSQFPLEDLFVFENDVKITLSSIKVVPSERNKGYGTAVLRRLQDYAAKVGKPLVLNPTPESRKKAALHKFYRNLGFYPNKGRKMDYRLSEPFARMWVWRPPK